MPACPLVGHAPEAAPGGSPACLLACSRRVRRCSVRPRSCPEGHLPCPGSVSPPPYLAAPSPPPLSLASAPAATTLPHPRTSPPHILHHHQQQHHPPTHPPQPPVPRRYQSTISGSFQVVEIIETFVNYMENLERCICIVYDSTAMYTGALGLKAIRLTDTFVEAYKEGERASGSPAGVSGWGGGWGRGKGKKRGSCWVSHAWVPEGGSAAASMQRCAASGSPGAGPAGGRLRRTPAACLGPPPPCPSCSRREPDHREDPGQGAVVAGRVCGDPHHHPQLGHGGGAHGGDRAAHRGHAAGL